MEKHFVTLTHLSNDVEHQISIFLPQIPPRRIAGENEQIERICVSDTIEGCIKAHPSIWYHAVGYGESGGCPYEDMGRKSVLLDHGKTGGLLVRAYDFLVDPSELVTPCQLQEKGWVPDAMETNEHWILKEKIPVRSYYVLIRGTQQSGVSESIFDFEVFEEKKIGKVENMLHFHDRNRIIQNEV